MWLLTLLPLASANSLLSAIPLICTPSVRGNDCGDGPLEGTLEHSNNAIEHAAILRRFNGEKHNNLMIQRIQHFTQYSKNPLRDFDLAFISLYSCSWGGRAGEAERALTLISREVLGLPYDAGVALMAGMAYAQYDAFILQQPWDLVTRQKIQARYLFQQAAALNRVHPLPGFEETLNGVMDYLHPFQGYIGL